MRLQIFRYKCGACGAWFEAPEISELAYGEFLLRSESGETRYLNANLDRVFLEVDALLRTNPRLSSFTQFQRADVLNEVFGVACDPDSMGGVFRIGTKPKCPSCIHSNITEWESPEPPRYVELDIVPITHLQWETLSDDEKRIRVHRALESLPLV